MSCRPSEREAAFVAHPPIRTVEWARQNCGRSGSGFMPEKHSSGACGTTLVRRPYTMVPEVAQQAQHAVAEILYGATHYMDGGGI
jgi:hypothetical protein